MTWLVLNMNICTKVYDYLDRKKRNFETADDTAGGNDESQN